MVCSSARFAAEVEADIQEQSGARSSHGLVVHLKAGNTKVIVAEELHISMRFVERQMLIIREEVVVCVRHDASEKGKKREKKCVTVCVCVCVWYDLRGQEPTFSADAGLSRLFGHHHTTPKVHLYADRAAGIEP